MSDKKIYTREEFEILRRESAQAMADDRTLQTDALDVLVRADQYRWIHQTTWFGEPILNLPQDLFALQEIIYRTRPKFIIEVGVAWGGSLLFYSTLMEVLGGEKIIGVDVFIPDDLRTRLLSHGNVSERITLINASSIDQQTLLTIRSMIGDCREVMVILDSYHTHEHVLEELRLYSSLVGKGHYLIVGDTIVEDIPRQEHRPRPWGPGNSPKTALRDFLKENRSFTVDEQIAAKLLFTCNPGGYLVCTGE